jgi:hypothetical protein
MQTATWWWWTKMLVSFAASGESWRLGDRDHCFWPRHYSCRRLLCCRCMRRRRRSHLCC